MRKLTIVAFFVIHSMLGFGQTFQRIENIDLKSGYLGFESWCDFDSDGFLDIFVTGVDFGGDLQHAII
jgi:hypothetical protein